MFIGSLAAAAAIGTRQFGVALPAGLVLAWLIGQSRVEKAPLYLAGLILPGVAGLWQALLGLTQPSVTQVLRLGHNLVYLDQGLSALLVQSVYRLAVLLEYLGLFLLPLTPILLFPYIQRVRADGPAGGRLRQWRDPALVVIATIFLIVLYTLSYYWVNGAIRSSLMPSLGWVLSLDASPVERVLLTVASTICGALLMVSLSARYLRPGRWRSLSPGDPARLLCRSHVHPERALRAVQRYIPYGLHPGRPVRHSEGNAALAVATENSASLGLRARRHVGQLVDAWHARQGGSILAVRGGDPP